MNQELEAKADELREVKTVLQARDALLTHIAVASSEPRVHELLQQSGHQDAKEVLAVQQLYEQETLKVRELTQTNELLKADLEQALRRQVKNLEEVLQRIRTEAASEFQQQLAKERSAHKQELSSLNDKQVRLLMQLETEQVNYRNLENSMTEGERKLKKKMNALEHSLEQLTVLYNQLVSQKAKMAIEMQVQEKKSKRKQDEVVKLQAEIAGLQKELTEARNKEAVEPKKSTWRSSFRIRKAIKGGRHAEILSPRSPLPEIPEFKAKREETEEERKD